MEKFCVLTSVSTLSMILCYSFWRCYHLEEVGKGTENRINCSNYISKWKIYYENNSQISTLLDSTLEPRFYLLPGESEAVLSLLFLPCSIIPSWPCLSAMETRSIKMWLWFHMSLFLLASLIIPCHAPRATSTSHSDLADGSMNVLDTQSSENNGTEANYPA